MDQDRSSTQSKSTTNNNNNNNHTHMDLNMSPSRRHTASSSSSSISNVLHITHLTRPFTVGQLKELLQKYGPLKSNPHASSKKDESTYFWLNPIKSICYVAYESESDAERARQALNNLTWPASNPKQLNVDFSDMDELIHYMNNSSSDLPVSSSKSGKTNGEEKGSRDRGEREKDREREREKKVREWDIPKLEKEAQNGKKSSSSSSSSQRKTEEKGGGGKSEKESRKVKEVESEKTEAAVDQTPPKTLDDLFRKTNTTPFIYWLPLTEEQYLEKQKAEDKRNEERLKRAEERRMKEEQEAAERRKAREARNAESANTTANDDIKKQKVYIVIKKTKIK
jgi:apoptotic chromatin condensation inducer in the nucleus